MKLSKPKEHFCGHGWFAVMFTD